MCFSKAKWIWSSYDGEPNQYIIARADFSAGSGVCALKISADSQYAAYINGELAAFGQYADYPEYKVFDEIDVSKYVRPGKNELRIIAYCQVIDSSVYRAGRPGLIYEIAQSGHILAFSCETTQVTADTGFKSGAIDRVTHQMGYTFEYDSRPQAQNWTNAALVNDMPAELHARPVKRMLLEPRANMRVTSQGVYWPSPKNDEIGMTMQYAPMAFRESRDMSGSIAQPSLPGVGVRYAADASSDCAGIYVTLDTGRETVGFIDFDIEVDADCEVLIGWGEHMDDQRVRTYVGGRNFAARYAAHKGCNRFMYELRRVGMRYITLFVGAKRFTLNYAGVRPVKYPLDMSPSFHTADALHSRIYDVCRDTLLACLHAHYEDCPWREQALYAMDSRNQMLCGYYAFGEYDMPRASLRLLALGQREDGLLELCAPARCYVTIPSFSLDFILALDEYLMFSGDRDFVREMLPVARRILDSMLARRDDKGLIPVYVDKKYWNFYEWRPGLDGHLGHSSEEFAGRCDAPLNMLAAECARRLAHMIALLGENGADAYAAAADELSARTDAAFWNAERGLYNTYITARGEMQHECELTQALAVYCGVCSSEHRARALELLASEKLPPVSLSYSIFLFDALLSAGDKYSRAAFARVARTWGDMLTQGATTFWETEQGGWDFDRGGSLCHAWSAVPLYLYMAYALGVKPTQPGFAKYEVKPLISGMYELSGKIKLPDSSMLTIGE